MLPNCILNYTILYLEVLTRHILNSNPGSATDRGDGQGEEGEEEVDDVLARLAVQHAPALGVHQQLHAERGSAGIGGGWGHGVSWCHYCLLFLHYGSSVLLMQ